MRFATWFASLSAVSLLTACGGGGGGGGGSNLPPPTLSGTVLFVPENAPLTLMEGAPAIDSSLERVWVTPGSAKRLRVESSSGRSLVRLRSAERVAVRARVLGESARVAHLDPVSMTVGAAGRSAQFLARGPFDLLVRGDAIRFELELSTRPLAGPVALDGHLGAFAVGDTLELDAASGGRATLSCAEALDFVLAASGPLAVFDARGREVARTEVAGELRIAAAPLESFELRAAAETTREITLRAEATDERRVCATLASPEAERVAFALPFEAPLATESTQEFVAGEVLVRARQGEALDEELARRAGRIAQRIPETSDLISIELPAGLDAAESARTTLALLASFEVSGKVEWAEPNRIRRALGGGTLTPNDPFYSLQWHYELIKLPEAWDLATGDANVVIAVIDTGERTHPDLDANTVAGFDFISSSTNAADGDGIDADPTDVGDGNGFTPSSFHGTHVAGTIGAVSNNATGIAGVNWNCSLMHLRVLGKQGGTDADIAQAVRYAAGLSNSSGTLPATAAKVLNLSLGGPGSSSTMQNVITAARSAGSVIVAAAGNNNSGENFFPASYTGVLSVSAVDLNAEKAPYSNFGPNVDLAAPGGDTSVNLNGDAYVDGVLSTLVDEDNGFAPTYVFYQGTSMACPHVAGLAALMLDANPALSVAEIEMILQSTTIDLGAPGRDDLYGNGLIQADRALVAALGTGSPTPVISISPSTLNFGSTVTELSILISNAGGGLLDVGAPSFTPISGGAFASLQTVPGGASTDVSAVIVTVDRTGLADGDYQGTITIPSNGGNVDVDVSMSVATAVVPTDVDLFLLLVEFDTLDTVAQAVLNPTTTLSWEFLDDGFGGAIPAGDYLLVCGSDDDGDLFILEPEDTYAGAWPTLNEIEILSLSRGDDLTGLDFPVTSSQSTLSAPSHPWAARGGFRLLSRPTRE